MNITERKALTLPSGFKIVSPDNNFINESDIQNILNETSDKIIVFDNDNECEYLKDYGNVDCISLDSSVLSLIPSETLNRIYMGEEDNSDVVPSISERITYFTANDYDTKKALIYVFAAALTAARSKNNHNHTWLFFPSTKITELYSEQLYSIWKYCRPSGIIITAFATEEALTKDEYVRLMYSQSDYK